MKIPVAFLACFPTGMRVRATAPTQSVGCLCFFCLHTSHSSQPTATQSANACLICQTVIPTKTEAHQFRITALKRRSCAHPHRTTSCLWS